MFLKIFRGDTFYILQRDRFHVALQRLVMSEAEPVELIERRHVSKGIVALISDLHLAEQFLLRAGQLVIRQAFGGELVNLVKQCCFHPLDFLRIRPEIKQEKPRDEPLHLAGADIIGEAHLLADANKKPRAQIAAGFVDQLERVSIPAEHVRATITDHDHPLRLVLQTFDRDGPGQRRWLRSISQRELARLHPAERLLENLFHFRSLDVPEDGNNAVPGDEIPVAELDQIPLAQFRDRLHGALAAERVGVPEEKRLAQNIPGDGRQLLFVFLDPGELNFLFARDRFLRHHRVEQNIGKQLRAQFEIRLRNIERDAEAIVAGVAANAAADGLDRVGDLLGGPRACAFEKHLRHQARDAICRRRFS